jgi:dihydrofolate synthase/folylpolyglutamate synthase
VAGRFIFDVAHNPDAFLRLFCELKKRYAHQSIDVIIGMSEDKDIRACLTIAAEHARLIYLTSAGTARSASPESMAAILDQRGNVSYILAETVYVAVEHAQHDAEAITVVCGSFYIMDEAKKAMRRLAASLS